MKYSYKAFFQHVYKQQGQKYAYKAKSEEEHAVWKQEFRAALRAKLGLDFLETMRIESPSVILEETVEEAAYMRYKYILETLPDVYMPFYMLVPHDVREPKPAVIAIPAHGANKDTVAGVRSCPQVIEKLERTPKEAYGHHLAMKGYVVFCPDPPGYGERQEGFSREDYTWMSDTSYNPMGNSCRDLSQTSEALGMSMTALEIWDMMRLVDYAESCECVDREQISCARFSGGGQYTMWLAALDDRIQKAAVSGYVHGYYDSMLDSHLCPCNYAPDLWLLGDISDICSLIAPRPLFVENGTTDVLDGPRGIIGPIEQVDAIRKAYQVFGCEERLVHHIFEDTHMWTGECLENGFF